MTDCALEYTKFTIIGVVEVGNIILNLKVANLA